MKYIDKLNGLLDKTNMRILDLGPNAITLNNGFTITAEADIRNFKRRLKAQTSIFLTLLENLYHVDQEIRIQSETEFRKLNARKGGIAVQKKHGNHIRCNLNTGIPWNKNLKGQYPHDVWSKGLTKDTNETLNKMSGDRIGPGNPMYGKPLSESHKRKQSNTMRNKILKGEFTPNSNNRNTHWESSFRGKKYRSSWEALYQYLNPDAQYETLRISYEYGVYIVDFIDKKNKKVIEVKPKELQKGKKFSAKITSLIKWAKEHEYDVVLFDQYMVKEHLVESNIDFSDFDKNTVRKLQALI